MANGTVYGPAMGTGGHSTLLVSQAQQLGQATLSGSLGEQSNRNVLADSLEEAMALAEGLLLHDDPDVAALAQAVLVIRRHYQGMFSFGLNAHRLGVAASYHDLQEMKRATHEQERLMNAHQASLNAALDSLAKMPNPSLLEKPPFGEKSSLWSALFGR